MTPKYGGWNCPRSIVVWTRKQRRTTHDKLSKKERDHHGRLRRDRRLGGKKACKRRLCGRSALRRQTSSRASHSSRTQGCGRTSHRCARGCCKCSGRGATLQGLD